MDHKYLSERAKQHLNALCVEIPTRKVGSQGNRQATDYVAELLNSFGFQTETPEFECIDWEEQGASLNIENHNFEVFPSPYSRDCSLSAELVSASNVAELEQLDTDGKLLLLHGELTREQLMPKNFPFYNPEHHQQIIGLLESKHPAAIIAATSRNPQLAGALYPFPLIEDGDFEIASVYMKDKEGEKLLPLVGQTATLVSNAARIPSTGHNVIGHKGKSLTPKVVFLAHIDTKINTPGALDNGTGIVILLLLAELLKGYQGDLGVEILAVNGEDYYGAPGQIHYLAHNQDTLKDIQLAINTDVAGYYQGKTEFTLYGCPEKTAKAAYQAFSSFPEIVEGQPWYQSDHSVFIQQGVPAMAITSETFMKLSAYITHTPEDRPELMDASKIVDIAIALQNLLVSLCVEK
ncbi:MAG: M28 family peptidase [Chloroflexota bacterium]